MVPMIDVRIVMTVISCIGNILVAFALIYAIGTAVLLIWPHTLLKVPDIPAPPSVISRLEPPIKFGRAARPR